MNDLKHIIHARSSKNGITIFSQKFPIIGVETCFDENENIVTQYRLLKFEDMYDVSEKKHHNPVLSLLLYILLMVFSLVLSTLTDNFGFFAAAFVFCITAPIHTSYFIEAFIKIKFKEPSTARFHGAEHMALNAYNELQRIPTLDEIKKFSRFSRHCSSQSQLITQLGIFLFIIIAILFYSYNYFLFMGIILAIGAFLLTIRKSNRFIFLQVFFVSKPTDKELLLAITALEELEIFENDHCNDDLNKIIIKYML